MNWPEDVCVGFKVEIFPGCVMADVIEHPEEFDEGEFAWCRLFLCERVEVEFVDGEEPEMGKTRVNARRPRTRTFDRPGRAAAL